MSPITSAHLRHTQKGVPMLGPITKDVLVVDFTYSRVTESATSYAQVIPCW